MRSNNKMPSSIRPYLARRHSKGDYEKPGGSFSRYDAYDMDVQFLQRILKADPSLPAYLPKARLCVYSNMLHWYVATSERSCPKPKRGYNTFMDMKAGVLIITGHPRLIVPSGMKREIQKCRALGRRFCLMTLCVFRRIDFMHPVGHDRVCVQQLHPHPVHTQIICTAQQL